MAPNDLLPLGSEDITNPEELEDTEEEAWFKVTLSYDELIIGEETIETEELSPEPKKEKPDPEDSTILHESVAKSHDSIEQQ